MPNYYNAIDFFSTLWSHSQIVICSQITKLKCITKRNANQKIGGKDGTSTLLRETLFSGMNFPSFLHLFIALSASHSLGTSSVPCPTVDGRDSETTKTHFLSCGRMKIQCQFGHSSHSDVDDHIPSP